MSAKQLSRASFLALCLGGGCLLACGGGCGKKEAPRPHDAAPVTVPSTIEPGAPKKGMAWIPAGVLKAGTPPDRAPRVADEEMPGSDVQLGGFYMDLYAYPNEPGAIPTSNVTRDEARQLCESKGKRLCSELEWERACKGQANATFEYGDTYRASACGTGITIEQAAKRPSGDRAQCKSGFGVMEMHGGVWEWTSSSWGRGSKDAALGVLRGGNSLAGELAGRCANAIGKPTSQKGPTMGFRCCSGAPNGAEVEIVPRSAAPLEKSAKPDELAAPFAQMSASAWSASDADVAALTFPRGWTWHPLPNEELVIVEGCTKDGARRSCGVLVGRLSSGVPQLVAQFGAGREPPEIIQIDSPRRLRARGTDAQGSYSRELTYAVGRVEVTEARRP